MTVQTIGIVLTEHGCDNADNTMQSIVSSDSNFLQWIFTSNNGIEHLSSGAAIHSNIDKVGESGDNPMKR